jgi:hypothetical protein
LIAEYNLFLQFFSINVYLEGEIPPPVLVVGVATRRESGCCCC